MKTYRKLISEISYGPALRPDHFAQKPAEPEDDTPVLRPQTKSQYKIRLKKQKFRVYVEDLQDEMASKYMETFRTHNKGLVKVNISDSGRPAPAQRDDHEPNNFVNVTYYEAADRKVIEHAEWLPERLIRFVLRFYDVEMPAQAEYKFTGGGKYIDFKLFYQK